MKKITGYLTTIIASTILFAGVSALYAWTGPTATPPAGNVSAPINVGTSSQNKLGALGLGGLAVFGKTLLTETNGYILPSSKSNMLLGVNGAVGAKEYCDEKGMNCVTTLGGGSMSATQSAGQIISGWPNKILCEGGNQKAVLYIDGLSGEGYSENRIRYSSFQDNGPHTSIHFKYSNGDYVALVGRSDAFGKAVDSCVAKGNIQNQQGFN